MQRNSSYPSYLRYPFFEGLGRPQCFCLHVGYEPGNHQSYTAHKLRSLGYRAHRDEPRGVQEGASPRQGRLVDTPGVGLKMRLVCKRLRYGNNYQILARKTEHLLISRVRISQNTFSGAEIFSEKSNCFCIIQNRGIG